ncbi:MAG: Hpt domain-containing protein [Acidobacteria bacterium]|nr:Hpt domain-containing protein [Acidobacteriota bacterium]MBI3281960.1 Hpt domain-containing protein [Acidobacteriota bacterium]
MMVPSAAQVEQSPASTLDWSDVLDRLGNDQALLREIAELFLEESPRLITEIAAAVRNRDAQALEHSAHTLKGSVANFGANAAFYAALRLEQMGRTGEFTRAPECLLRLQLGFADLCSALTALLRS